MNMEQDIEKTDVIFRVISRGDFKGHLIALFPHQCDTLKVDVQSYMWNGQHGAADYNGMVAYSKLATEEQRAEMKRHLERDFGYNLNVIKKQNREKFLVDYKRVNKRG